MLFQQQNGTTSPIVSLYGPSGKLRSKEALKKARQRARKRGPKREPKLTLAQLQYRKDYYQDSKYCKANGLDLRAYRIANGKAKYNLNASQKTNREAEAKAKAVPVGSPPLVASNSAATAAAPSMVAFSSIAPPIVAHPSIFAAPTPTVGSTPLVSTPAQTPIQADPQSVLFDRMTPQQKADLRALNQRKSDKLATALEIIKDNRDDMGSALGTMNTTMNTTMNNMNTTFNNMNITMNNVYGFMNEHSLMAKSVAASIEGSCNEQKEFIFSEVKAERGSGQFDNANAAAPVAMGNAGTNLLSQFDNENAPPDTPPNANAPSVAHAQSAQAEQTCEEFLCCLNNLQVLKDNAEAGGPSLLCKEVAVNLMSDIDRVYIGGTKEEKKQLESQKRKFLTSPLKALCKQFNIHIDWGYRDDDDL